MKDKKRIETFLGAEFKGTTKDGMEYMWDKNPPKPTLLWWVEMATEEQADIIIIHDEVTRNRIKRFFEMIYDKIFETDISWDTPTLNKWNILEKIFMIFLILMTIFMYGSLLLK